jgi:hypothetical protein
VTSPSAEDVLATYHEDVSRRLRGHRRLVEKALAQVSDEAFFRRPDDGSNSIAVIVKHLAGNMRSRFTDFLTTDGEKPDRDRDGEFEVSGGEETRDELMRRWAEGFDRLFASVEPLTAEDLGRTVRIAGEPHSVIGALNRHLAHFAYHAGQIAYLARLWAGPDWKTVSIPKGGSAEYFAAVRRKHEGRG